MNTTKKIEWLSEPEVHDYPAALSYLSLIFEEKEAQKLVDKLKKTDVKIFKAKDIFRASALSLLGVSNSHVKKDISKIKKRQKLSPLILIRNPTNAKLIIADGYHRLCAVYSIDEDALIPCKITSVI
jgi:hypothetical protein